MPWRCSTTCSNVKDILRSTHNSRTKIPQGTSSIPGRLAWSVCLCHEFPGNVHSRGCLPTNCGLSVEWVKRASSPTVSCTPFLHPGCTAPGLWIPMVFTHSCLPVAEQCQRQHDSRVTCTILQITSSDILTTISMLEETCMHSTSYWHHDTTVTLEQHMSWTIYIATF